MNKIVLIVILLLNFLLYIQGQDTIRFVTDWDVSGHINLRNAKGDTVMDWWVGVSTEIVLDSVCKVNMSVSTERDEGVKYFAFSSGVEFKYGKASYIKDIEKDIEFYQVALFVPIFKYFKIGFDYMNDGKGKVNQYVKFEWKWVNAEIVAFDKIGRIKYSVCPEWKVGKSVSIGIKTEGLWLDKNRFKWQTGMTLKIDIL